MARNEQITFLGRNAPSNGQVLQRCFPYNSSNDSTSPDKSTVKSTAGEPPRAIEATRKE